MEYNNYTGYNGYDPNLAQEQYMRDCGISATKQSIKNYLCSMLGATSIEEVDMFDTPRTRHICPGSGYITILDSGVIPVMTNRGMVNAEVFFCPNCYKLIVSGDSLTIL